MKDLRFVSQRPESSRAVLGVGFGLFSDSSLETETKIGAPPHPAKVQVCDELLVGDGTFALVPLSRQALVVNSEAGGIPELALRKSRIEDSVGSDRRRRSRVLHSRKFN